MTELPRGNSVNGMKIEIQTLVLKDCEIVVEMFTL